MSKRELEIIGKRLYLLRKSYVIEQEVLSQIIDVSQQEYSLFEKGKNEFSIEFLIRIADFYCVTLDYICGRSENPDTNCDGTSQNWPLLKC